MLRLQMRARLLAVSRVSSFSSLPLTTRSLATGGGGFRNQMDINTHSFPTSSSSFSHSFSQNTSSSNTPYFFSTFYSTRPRLQQQQLSQQPPQMQSQSYQQSQNITWNPNSSFTPPPLLQEVYILACKSCDTFLTNRGMRAVLLLQPDVPLYSSDALPVNCSAKPGPPEFPPLQEHLDNNFSSACPSGLPALPLRTCECLTQTLSCHGCGNSIGYMVVIPCLRCCSSVTPTNRHTNRHRFVFFNKEINATTRRYVSHEPGVIQTSPPFVSAVTSARNLQTPTPSSSDFAAYPFPPSTHHVIERRAPSDVSQSIPPGAFNDSFTSLGGSSTIPNSSDPHSASPVQFVLLKPSRGRLRAGDILYWHNLSRNGEIPAVTDDERARWTPESMSPYAGR